MTISSAQNAVTYNGNAVTSAFPVPFYFLQNSDLVVTKTTGILVVTLTLNFDYTVTGGGSLTGGTVSCVAPPGNTSTLSIRRVVPVTQLTDYVTDDAFPAESHEKALDKLTMICQQLQTNLDNAVLAAAAGGEANTASNLDAGYGIYRQKAGVDLQFRSISSPGAGGIGLALAGNRIEVDVTYLLAHSNLWSGGQQYNEYNIPINAAGVDHSAWVGLVHNNSPITNTDNIVALTGHAYYDSPNVSVNSGAFGIATEAWSNALGTTTLIGGELSCISQNPTGLAPVVGGNLVFKNRSDVATHPIAAVIDGPYYNKSSTALFISSQRRPSGGGAAWANVGSGWNNAIRIGDPGGLDSGLDWEGGNSGSGVRNWSTILNLEACAVDMAGGWPWLALWKTGSTYFGIRFNNNITTGAVESVHHTPTAGGAGYGTGDVGTIDGGSGTATYVVTNQVAGAVTNVTLTGPGTGYTIGTGKATTATSGGGTGLTLNIIAINGEKLEFWRTDTPGTPSSGAGKRYGFVNLTFDAGTPDHAL